MPTYDYKCRDCGSSKEFNLKISERDVTENLLCPECDQTGTFERQVSAANVGYLTTVAGGYGNKVPDGFRDVLRKIDERSPGSRMKETSSFL
jgi:putative FmdB family regulatory protein